MPKSVLVINCGWEQAPLIDRLVARGDCVLYGIHFDDTPHQPDAFAEINSCGLRDTETMIAFADRIKPDAVISDQCDSSVYHQALIAWRHGLPGPSVEAAQFSNNKFLQRQRSAERGQTIPAFRLCATAEDVIAFAHHHGYPVIVKPVDNRGSFGVVKVEGLDQVRDAFLTALCNSAGRLVLVEEFIVGIHVTVDGYAFPGQGPRSLALATKQLLDDKTQVSVGIAYPGGIAEPDFSALLTENERVNAGLDYHFGMIHSEYMVREGEFFLIESSNRGGGVFTSEIIVPESSGIDVLGQYIADCLGEKADNYSTPRHAAVILRFFSFEPGQIASIHGWDTLQSHPDVMASRLAVKEGDFINPVTTDANRHGFFILRGSAADADRLLDTVKVEYA